MFLFLGYTEKIQYEEQPAVGLFYILFYYRCHCNIKQREFIGQLHKQRVNLLRPVQNKKQLLKLENNLPKFHKPLMKK